MNSKSIQVAIRDIPDFPQKGILFKDVTPVLQDPALFKAAIDILAERHLNKGIKTVAAIDARGFIFGAAVAYRLGAGFVPVRKKGKLPYKAIEASYSLEYGTATLELHIDALKQGKDVLLVDDLLATGGTAMACAELIEKLGGCVVEMAFLVELAGLKGRQKLSKYNVFSAITY